VGVWGVGGGGGGGAPPPPPPQPPNPQSPIPIFENVNYILNIIDKINIF